MYTKVPAGLVHVVQMAIESIELEEQLRESHRELQKIQRSSQIANGAFSKLNILH